MRKYNRTIAAVLAATLCSLALMTGCGNKNSEVSVQPETAAAENAEAVADDEAAENTEAAAGDEAAEDAEAAATEETAAGTEATVALPGEEEYVMQTDLEGCDTFTQIVDKLEPGKGYANVTLGDTDVLLVSAELFDDETIKAAVGAEVFIYSDGVPQYIGHIHSGGTATPLALKDGIIYSAGHHYVTKSTVKDGKLVVLETAYQTFDKEGNVTYHYDSTEGGNHEGPEDEAVFESFNTEYQEAEMIGFDVVE